MPAEFNVENFVATTSIYSFARKNRWEVIIDNPVAADEQNRFVSLYCEEANWPGMNIATKSFKPFGPGRTMPTNVEYQGDGQGLTLKFYVDQNMFVREYFDAWMHMVVMPAYFNVNYRVVYLRNMLLRQLDEANNITFEMIVWDVFPRTMEQMNMPSASPLQDAFQKVIINFAFRYWETRTINHSLSRGTTAPSLDGTSLGRIFDPSFRLLSTVPDESAAETGRLGRL